MAHMSPSSTAWRYLHRTRGCWQCEAGSLISLLAQTVQLDISYLDARGTLCEGLVMRLMGLFYGS